MEVELLSFRFFRTIAQTDGRRQRARFIFPQRARMEFSEKEADRFGPGFAFCARHGYWDPDQKERRREPRRFSHVHQRWQTAVRCGGRSSGKERSPATERED